MVVSDMALVCFLVSQWWAPPPNSYGFSFIIMQHFAPILVCFPLLLPFVSFQSRYLTGMLISGSKEWGLQRRHQHLLWLQEESWKELQGGCQASWSWESGHGKGGTRKGGEKEIACHLSLQDSCKVLIMCVLFIPCLCSLNISWETFQRKGGEEETKSLLLDWGMQAPPLLPAPSFLCCCSWRVSLEALT